MSMFLGPIHYWLYNKIKLVESRRDRFMAAAREKFGKDFDPIAEELDNEYGPKLNGRELEQMLGDNPIHGFLQSMIQKVETAEGKLVAKIIEKYNGDGFNFLLEEAEKHGRQTGERAVAEMGLTDPSAEELLRALNDYYLEGMPCDQVSSVAQRSEQTVELRHTQCIHRNNWETSGGPFMEMCCFTNAWIGGFAQAVKPNMKYERKTSFASGDPGCLAEFNVE